MIYIIQMYIESLVFATLYLSGKKVSLMERLQISAMGAQSAFEPSLINLPASLSLKKQFDSPPCAFSKNIFSKERMEPWLSIFS